MEEKEEETTSSNNGEMERREKEEEEEQAWGTLEELLLVCAVNRHGFNSWDSISTELQKRIKHSSLNNNDKNDVVNDADNNAVEGGGGGGGEGTVDCSFSSGNCRKKYVHLKRRFEEAAETAETAVEVEEGGEEHLVRMVDELRKLRVEELKREVHRHDVSIVSLQLKVKRLEEERESSKVKAEDVDEQQQDDDEEEEKTILLSDLRIKPEENAAETGEKGDEPEKSSVEKVITADSAENRSSNSTNHPKTDNIKPVSDSARGEPGAVRVERKRSEPVVGDNNRKVNRLSESLSESRRESTRQQSSDVQSSASLSKKKRRRFRGDNGDELEAEELSPANKRINAKSQPLIRFLESLRSHKHGSVFQRRLPSQETEKYRNVIRQHMDLDTVQSRLDKGIYCDCHPKFYRDLILTFTNAVLFYRKSTAEHIAAKELRKLVMDEVAQKTRKPKVQPRKPDLEPQNLEPVVKKPRSSTTMVVCRRRISNSMQALSDGMKKADTNQTTSTTNSKNNISSNVVNGREEKVKPDHNQKRVNGSNNISSGSLSNKKEKEKDGDKGGGGGGDENLKKLLTRERSNLGNGGLRLSNSNGKKIISKEGNKREKMGNVGKDNKQESSEGERAEVMERRKINNADQKQEKGTPTPVLKKQGVAKFLKRMKQNSPSSQEKVKNNDSEEDEEEGGIREKTQSTNTSNARKAGGNLKKNISKEVEVVNTTRRSSGRRGEKEAAASRKWIGRPPKRKAAMMSGSTPDSAKGGRSGGRDGGEKFKKKPRR
ncbi:claspin-like [Chenopodium quinoa]|uniref:claspin-like n=1 Tax=Chenopodium quinoa TaxID=63459 RepID=UPI000B77A790|nr:claspin-like [Chenopodium quinoa]